MLLQIYNEARALTLAVIGEALAFAKAVACLLGFHGFPWFTVYRQGRDKAGRPLYIRLGKQCPCGHFIKELDS